MHPQRRLMVGARPSNGSDSRLVKPLTERLTRRTWTTACQLLSLRPQNAHHCDAGTTSAIPCCTSGLYDSRIDSGRGGVWPPKKAGENGPFVAHGR